MQDSSNSIQLTLFSSDKPLTKRLYRDNDGKIAKRSTGLASGTASRIDVNTASELASVFSGLTPTQCLAYGVTQRLTAQIGSQKHLRGHEISRTRENFSWPDGAGVLFLDFDGSFTPEDIPRFRDALHLAMPELEGVAHVWTRSSSSGIDDPLTGETTRGGLHCYVLIDNAHAIPVIGKQLYDALWLHGHGHYILSSGERPAALERNLIDAAVWQPERLDYAAAPILEDGLERHGGTVCEVHDGPLLVTKRVAKLTDDQEQRIADLKRSARDSVKPYVIEARAAKLEALPSVEREQKRRQYLAADRGTLDPSILLHFADGTTVPAGDVLADLDTYKGRRLADPLEPSYGGSDARIAMITDSGKIFSHAHGGQTFRILPEPFDAPADVVALDVVPSDSEIIGACYRNRVDAKAGALDVIARETLAEPEHVVSVWRDHLAEKYKALSRDGETVTVGTFDEARQMIDAGASVLFLAALGSGKTQQLGKHAMATGRRCVAATSLRSLTFQHAEAFSAAHYDDHRAVRDNAPRVVSTIHSLPKQDLRGVTVLVLDEFAAAADLLMDTREDRIMGAHLQSSIMDTLLTAVENGTQIVALDGDLTPTARQLATELGLACVSVDEKPYADPIVNITTRQTSKGIPHYQQIIGQLEAGESVAIATDGKDHAESLGRVFKDYAPLVIHAGNARDERTPQAAFMTNPEAGARRHKLVIYTPAMSVGVSIVETQAHVYVMQTAGTLDAAGMWQLARRYRRPAGGVIHWSVGQRLTVPQRPGISQREIVSDISIHAMRAGAFDPTVARLIATTRQQALHDSNPLHATIGHLTNIGVLGCVAVEAVAEAVEESQAAKEATEQSAVERVANAPSKPSNEVPRNPKTEAEYAIATRYRIEQSLRLSDSGPLDLELVRACLKDRLEVRVGRQVALFRQGRGIDLDCSSDLPVGFAYQPRMNEQADIVRSIVADLTDSDGKIEVTATRAVEIAAKYRARIRAAHKDIAKPGKKLSTTQASRWLRDLLYDWGYTKLSSKATRGVRTYYYGIHTSVEAHVLRVIGEVKSEGEILLEAAS